MTLNYLEAHVVDHCNLNCKGCGHFSPLIKNKEFANFDIYKKDLNRLSEMFTTIKSFHILGGEPLLNPQLIDFLKYSRSILPASNIYLVTNGILLEKQDKSFWNSCNDNNIAINLTSYPIKINLPSIISMCRNFNIRFNISFAKKKFIKIINIRGDSNPSKSFKLCKSLFACTFLKNGHIYPCAFSCHVKYFNDFFGQKIKADEAFNGIDIYSNSAAEIQQFLNKPTPYCKYCTSKPQFFDWGLSERKMSEWIAEDNNSFKLHLNYIFFFIYILIKKIGFLNSKLYRFLRNLLLHL